VVEKLKPQKPEGKLLPIRIEGADEMPVCYSNHIFVTHTRDEFFVTFSQIHPPYLLSPTRKEVEQITHASARVVARIALSPNKMKELIKTLKNNYDKFSTSSKVGK
jgi:hypothetical protein